MDPFLPMTAHQIQKRGWHGLDVVIVTGDAYVDHASYGAAVIGRVLEAEGLRVGIIAQPDFKSVHAFTALGRPRLFFGITAGNMDSMVANYTAHKRPRLKDDYSPGGRPGLRPDHAVIVYANRVREAFKDVPIVIGGIEASLRRFAHYDWWKDEVRRSVIVDSRADILVYGMGETQAVEIARRCASGRPLAGIRGTVVIEGSMPEPPAEVGHGRREPAGAIVEIPSYEEVKADPDRFNEALRSIVMNQDPVRGKTVVQRHANRYVVQYPPAAPLTGRHLDAVYELPYARSWHPAYDAEGGVPGFETVRVSLTSHRGCPGECAFCGLSLHQGRMVTSRSEESVVREAETLSRTKEFRGTISDVGGPTANLYGAGCKRWTSGTCAERHCLTPEPCRSLDRGFEKGLSLYRRIAALPHVKHVFIESGFRHDLLVDDRAHQYLREICRNHVSGRMKVAPEHSSGHVLSLMNKPGFETYERFAGLYRSICRELGKDQYLVNYFISAHPGCTLNDTLSMSLKLQELGIYPEQIQDFMPLPMTVSGAMYHTGKDPFTGTTVPVARTFRERKMHRALIQYRNPKNTPLVREALKLLGKEHLAKRLMPAQTAKGEGLKAKGKTKGRR